MKGLIEAFAGPDHVVDASKMVVISRDGGHRVAWGVLARVCALTLLLITVGAQAVPLVVAAAGSLAGAYVAGTVFSLTAGTLLYSAVSAVSGFVVSSLLGGLLGNQSGAAQDTGAGGSGSFTAEARGRMQVVRSAVASRTLVYGQVMVSGPLVYAEVGGPNNSQVHLVIPLANHEVEEISDVYFNDIRIAAADIDSAGSVTAGAFAGYTLIRKHLGTAGDPAEVQLVAQSAGKWTAAHRLAGIAYLYIRLDYSQDIFPGGIPNVKALVKGKKLYDPRSGLTVWSNNQALVVRDYLVTPALAGGLGVTASEVDDTQISAAANICDEAVTLADASTQVRYTADGTVDTSRRPLDIMADLLSAGAGVLTYPQGVFKIWPGAYAAPAVTLTASDLRGPVQLTTRMGRRDLFNAVKGTYSNPANFWQPSDFPQVSNATYATQDGGDVITRDINLPFTTDAIRAQRIAKINLEKSRQGMTVALPCNMRQAFGLAMWDTVSVTLSQLGWSAKVFRVVQWQLAADGLGVDITLREESAASYAWTSGDATVVDAAPDTNLPSPFLVAAPGAPTVTESLYTTTGSAGVKSRVVVSWAASADAFVRQYEVQYKPTNDTTWYVFPWQSDTTLNIDDATPGVYDTRVRAINGVGVRSAYSPVVTAEIKGLTALPADVAGFSVVASAGFALATWQLTGDLDVQIGGRVVIRHAPVTTGATWSGSLVLEEFAGSSVSGTVPLITGTYLAKFRDSTGSYSNSETTFVVTEGMVTGLSTLATITESTTFPGTKTSLTVSAGTLKLDSAVLIDSVASFDGIADLDSLGGVAASGSYAFNGTYSYDGTTVATRRFEADIAVAATDTGDFIDARVNNIDDWDSIDGSIVNDCDVTLYASTTNDNPAGSPTWGAWTPFMVADFNCRAARFKLDFVSGSITHNIAVSLLAVVVKA